MNIIKTAIFDFGEKNFSLIKLLSFIIALIYFIVYLLKNVMLNHLTFSVLILQWENVIGIGVYFFSLVYFLLKKDLKIIKIFTISYIINILKFITAYCFLDIVLKISGMILDRSISPDWLLPIAVIIKIYAFAMFIIILYKCYYDHNNKSSQ
jgi:hypothetical protein